MRTRSQARRLRQQQQVPPNLVEPPKDTMADNRTMAELLQAPTEGYEDRMMFRKSKQQNLRSKHGLRNSCPDKQFFGVTFGQKPADCYKHLERQVQLRHSRSKAIIAKVSTSASTSGVSPDVAELKDMVRALLLDKQTSPELMIRSDPRKDILRLEAILIVKPYHHFPTMQINVPELEKELKNCEAKTDETSKVKPSEVVSRTLPPHLEYCNFGQSLGQRHEKHFRPIHYASKTMNEAESRYTTTEKEMLAVVYAFEKFRSYLVMNKCTVYTDHSALNTSMVCLNRKLPCGKFRDQRMSTPAEKKISSKTIARIVKNSHACIFIKSFTSSASFWESRSDGLGTDIQEQDQKESQNQTKPSTEWKGQSQ
ncbi:reverse transcriptase domain-containing protein, partial [Tanacetum coccineum]